MTRYVEINLPEGFENPVIYREHDTDLVQALSTSGEWFKATLDPGEKSLQDMIDFFLQEVPGHPNFRVRELTAEEITELPE